MPPDWTTGRGANRQVGESRKNVSGKTKNILVLLFVLGVVSVFILPSEQNAPVPEKPDTSKARVLLTPLGDDTKLLSVEPFEVGGEGRPAALASIYQSHSHHSHGNHPPGPVQVSVTETAPPILVLTSYEPVDWYLNVHGDLEELVVSGYHSQVVHGVPEGVKVTVKTYEDGQDYLPIVSGPEDQDLRELVSELNKMGYSVVKYGSRYEAQEILIN